MNYGLSLSSKRSKTEFQQLKAPNMQMIGPTQRRFAAFRHGFCLIRLKFATTKAWLGRSGLFPAAPNPKPKTAICLPDSTLVFYDGSAS